jgi:hypothetical protein
MFGNFLQFEFEDVHVSAEVGEVEGRNEFSSDVQAAMDIGMDFKLPDTCVW